MDMENNLKCSNVCIVCFNDPTKDDEQPDNPEILVCDTPYEDTNYVRNAGHGMCTDCYELCRFRYSNGTCPLCKEPWTRNIAHYPQRLRDRIDGGGHVVTAENIKSKFRGNVRDYGLAEHLIGLIEPGFDFYIAGGESLFFHAILERNADIFDKLLRKAIETNNSHLFMEANVRSSRVEEYGIIYTALQWACAYGWSYAIQQLVMHGADPNYYLGHCPPLHVALQFKHEASAEMVRIMGARVDMVDEYGLGPLFYFSPDILRNAYWNWREGPEDEDILSEPGRSMARQRAMSSIVLDTDTSLKLLSEMCRQGADVNQFGVFPRKEAQSSSTQENLEMWRQRATMVPPLFAILANQHDVHGSNDNGRRFRDQPELQAECWEALGNWMVEVTKIFARSGCDIYGRIHGGETLLYWVEKWSKQSQAVPCRLAYAKVLQHLRYGAWLQMLPLQRR